MVSIYEMYIFIFIMMFTSNIEGGIIYQNEQPSHLLSPFVKEYNAFPVKLVKVTNTVAVPVPYPIHLTKNVPYPVTVTKPLPYPVPHPVPVQITKPILIQHAVPLPLIKPVPLPQPVIPTNSISSLGPTNNNYLHHLNHRNQQNQNKFPETIKHVGHSNTATNGNTDYHESGSDENDFDSYSPHYYDYGSNNFYNNGKINDYGIPSQDFLPPSSSAEFGSDEFGIPEADDDEHSHEFGNAEAATDQGNQESSEKKVLANPPRQ